MTDNPRFEIYASVDHPVQSLAPPSKSDRCEGVAFSSCGNIIGAAGSDSNAIFMYRRQASGLFEETPYCIINGPRSRLAYPHDVAFSLNGETELLAVAARGGAIVIFEKNRSNETYGPEPVFEISGPRAKLNFSDGVAFVPPKNDYLAACNLEIGNVSFFRRVSDSPISFGLDPVFDLRHNSLSHPDGLAFSQCGTWLAVANHRNHSVSVFRRRNRILSAGKLEYQTEPVTIIKDRGCDTRIRSPLLRRLTILSLRMREPITSAYTSQSAAIFECAGLHRPCPKPLLDQTTNSRKSMRATKWKADPKA